LCGITGFLSSIEKNENQEQIAARMLEPLFARGPDSLGIWSDAATGITLAHRRLSILELSEAGHQPMLSASGRYVVSFNGEIYNHLELRDRLANLYSWRGLSDTETLLACIESWGLEKSLRVFKGMFAFALWDRDSQSLFLCRDRMGEKPLYYGWQNGVFLFGSVLSALKAHPAFNAEISRQALALFLRFNYVPAPSCIYQGINKLLPGHYLEINTKATQTMGDLVPKAYWSIERVVKEKEQSRINSKPFEQSVQAFEKVLLTAIERQCLSDVPIGALLSGGVDSSLVCALMQSIRTQPINTYTIGFHEGAYNEANFAKELAKHLGSSHNELMITEQDCLNLVPKLPEIYDEPFADSSQIPTTLVAQLAKSQVSVALSGDGADELFAGYTRYSQVAKVWRQVAWMPEPARQLFAKLLTGVNAKTLNALSSNGYALGFAQLGDKLHRLGHRLNGLSCAEDLYKALVSEWCHGQPVIAADLSQGVERAWADIERISQQHQELSLAERMMLTDSMTYLPDDILAKVDRAAMSVSLETRAPYLDVDVVEFAWALPIEHKISGSVGKTIMRDTLRKYVPESLFNRPKQGFAVPLDSWLRGALYDWGESLLSEEKLTQQGFFDVHMIRNTWRKHQLGQGNYGYRLWSVLMFQCWLERNSQSVLTEVK